jgi:nucleoside 2-deoxyribosyltransferase
VKIYLAGPIHGKDDSVCRAWRINARFLLETAGHVVLDPMQRDYRGAEEEHAEELVADDKDEIESSDAVLVNANAPGWGTAMEVLYAIQMGKKVVAFATHAAAPTISPWLRCHTHAVYELLGYAINGLVDGSSKGMR